MIELEELRRPKRALLLTFPTNNTAREIQEDRDELSNLCISLGVEVIDALPIRFAEAHPRYLIGSGKAEEIAKLCEELEAELLVFDEDLSPSQQRNWERLTKIPVIDRQEVILQIFSDRAQTREARLQVEYAKLQYELPRLTRAWAHLGRQRGGAKGTRGEGETQLEIDRRIIEARIARIRSDLRVVAGRREILRKARSQSGIFTVALVGYTNAGKSSVLRAVAGGETFVADKLFATLDPAIRRVEGEDGSAFLLSDTVGFVRKLPHRLIDAFKSTLEETLQADMLLHVVDISNPALYSHIRTTRAVLDEIGAGDIPEVLVFNKIDKLEDQAIAQQPEPLASKPDLSHFATGLDTRSLFVSAKNGTGIPELLQLVHGEAQTMFTPYTASIPYDRSELAALCHREGSVENVDYKETGIAISGRIPKRFFSSLQPFAVLRNDV